MVTSIETDEKPNYLRMAYECFQQDCGVWYTQDAHYSFARYLERKGKSSATLEDLSDWKRINKLDGK